MWNYNEYCQLNHHVTSCPADRWMCTASTGAFTLSHLNSVNLRVNCRARHSKTLAEHWVEGSPNIQSLPVKPCLLSCWHPMSSVISMLAELKCAQSTHSGISTRAPHALTVSTLALYTFDEKKTTHCSWQVKCQTPYLYILISNNEACYLPTSDDSGAKCWLCLSVVCLLLNVTHLPK